MTMMGESICHQWVKTVDEETQICKLLLISVLPCTVQGVHSDVEINLWPLYKPCHEEF